MNTQSLSIKKKFEKVLPKSCLGISSENLKDENPLPLKIAIQNEVLFELKSSKEKNEFYSKEEIIRQAWELFSKAHEKNSRSVNTRALLLFLEKKEVFQKHHSYEETRDLILHEIAYNSTTTAGGGLDGFFDLVECEWKEKNIGNTGENSIDKTQLIEDDQKSFFENEVEKSDVILTTYNLDELTSDQEKFVFKILQEARDKLRENLTELHSFPKKTLHNLENSNPSISKLVQEIHYSIESYFPIEENHLNEFGLPFHPLEIEVHKMVKQAELKNLPEHPYITKRDGGKWANPLEFLEEIYGKYLKKYNKQNNFLFQDQLRKIDYRLYLNLHKYISRQKQEVSSYIPSKSERVSLEIEQLEKIKNVTKIKNSRKINKLEKNLLRRKKT